MSLIPEIDNEKTKKNAAEVLGIYRRLERMAHEEYTPKVTASFSFEVKGFTGSVNSAVENSVVRKVTAEQELAKIVKALNKLNAFHRQLLYERYVIRNELSDIQIYMELGMSERSFYREMDKALICFAEAYDGGRLLADKWPNYGRE